LVTGSRGEDKRQLASFATSGRPIFGYCNRSLYARNGVRRLSDGAIALCQGANYKNRVEALAVHRPGTLAPILVVDDDPNYRGFVIGLLEGLGRPLVEATTGAEALWSARLERPAAVLLDVRLPDISGYEVCRALRDRFGEQLPIMFVSGTRTESHDRVGGMLLGADDYVVKPFAPDELVARVRRLVARSADGAGNGDFELTARETEVLRLLATGKPQIAIADELVISEKTVATHIQHILRKLGVHSRAEAVAFAHRNGVSD
jgi:DNA-binding NarL/FixJ family response regulator